MAEVFNGQPTYWPPVGYTTNWCSSCNAWVGPDHDHYRWVNPMSPFEPETMRRIASALERIAAALERSDGR